MSHGLGRPRVQSCLQKPVAVGGVFLCRGCLQSPSERLSECTWLRRGSLPGEARASPRPPGSQLKDPPWASSVSQATLFPAPPPPDGGHGGVIPLRFSSPERSWGVGSGGENCCLPLSLRPRAPIVPQDTPGRPATRSPRTPSPPGFPGVRSGGFPALL